MTSTWALYRAIGKQEWRQFRLPPSGPTPAGPHGQPAGEDATQGAAMRPMNTEHEDTYIRDIRSVCGQEMEVGESIYKRLKDANLLPRIV